MQFVYLICILLCSFLYFPFQSSAAIKGVLDFVTIQPNGTARFSGWACDTGINVSIPVHIYLNGAAGVGQGYTSINANVSSESAVSTACSTSGTPHRFVFDMPAADVITHQGKTVFMHGISTSNANLLIDNSGAFTIPAPPTPPTNANQNIFYKYDALGRLVCVQDDFAGNRKFEYDDAGNRTNITEVICD